MRRNEVLKLLIPNIENTYGIQTREQALSYIGSKSKKITSANATKQDIMADTENLITEHLLLHLNPKSIEKSEASSSSEFHCRKARINLAGLPQIQGQTENPPTCEAPAVARPQGR